ncbi:MAG: hypothetical protein V1729_06525 [Candidatus Woesearchaeota archaeon]
MEMFNPLYCYQNDSYLHIGGRNYCSIVGYDCEYQDKVLVALARTHMPDGSIRAKGVCACNIVDVIESAICDFVDSQPTLRPPMRVELQRQMGRRT